MFSQLGQCSICKKEYTSTHIEAQPGVILYVCPRCLEKSKDNFVWVCMNCGKSYMRPKQQIFSRLAQYGLANVTLLSHGVPLIQGIDICIECDPQGIVECVRSSAHEYDIDPA